METSRMRAIIRRASASSGRRLINHGATTFQSKVLSNSGTVVEMANAPGRLSHSEAYRKRGAGSAFVSIDPTRYRSKKMSMISYAGGRGEKITLRRSSKREEMFNPKASAAASAAPK